MNSLKNKKALHRKAFQVFVCNFHTQKVNYVNTKKD